MSKSPMAASGLALALVIAACGGGPSGTPAGTAPTGPEATPTERPADGPAGSESELEAAARALFEAFKDDDEAYFLGLSLACRSSAGFGIVSERNNSRQARIRQVGIDLSAIEITDVAIGAFDGRSATVALTLSGTDGNEFLENQPNPWVFEDGGWHWDDCDPFETGGGGGGGLEGSGPNDAIAVGLVPTIADWYVYSSYVRRSERLPRRVRARPGLRCGSGRDGARLPLPGHRHRGRWIAVPDRDRQGRRPGLLVQAGVALVVDAPSHNPDNGTRD